MKRFLVCFLLIRTFIEASDLLPNSEISQALDNIHISDGFLVSEYASYTESLEKNLSDLNKEERNVISFFSDAHLYYAQVIQAPITFDYAYNLLQQYIAVENSLSCSDRIIMKRLSRLLDVSNASAYLDSNDDYHQKIYQICLYDKNKKYDWLMSSMHDNCASLYTIAQERHALLTQLSKIYSNNNYQSQKLQQVNFQAVMQDVTVHELPQVDLPKAVQYDQALIVKLQAWYRMHAAQQREDIIAWRRFRDSAMKNSVVTSIIDEILDSVMRIAKKNAKKLRSENKKEALRLQQLKDEEANRIIQQQEADRREMIKLEKARIAIELKKEKMQLAAVTRNRKEAILQVEDAVLQAMKNVESLTAQQRVALKLHEAKRLSEVKRAQIVKKLIIARVKMEARSQAENVEKKAIENIVAAVEQKAAIDKMLQFEEVANQQKKVHEIANIPNDHIAWIKDSFNDCIFKSDKPLNAAMNVVAYCVNQLEISHFDSNKFFDTAIDQVRILKQCDDRSGQVVMLQDLMQVYFESILKDNENSLAHYSDIQAANFALLHSLFVDFIVDQFDL